MKHDPVKKAWLDVGDELEAIGLKLKLHLEQEMAEEPETSEDDDRHVFERLARKLDDAIDAVENAAEDEAVRSDLREAGQRLVDAMSTTYRAATRATRRQMQR